MLFGLIDINHQTITKDKLWQIISLLPAHTAAAQPLFRLVLLRVEQVLANAEIARRTLKLPSMEKVM
jgi:hypothetical protein